MQCCYMTQDMKEQCPKEAEFEIWAQNARDTTQACTEHVGALLEDGTSSVWPIEPSK